MPSSAQLATLQRPLRTRLGTLMRQGPFVTIKELVVVRPGAVVPEGVTLAPMTIWEGNPGQCRNLFSPSERPPSRDRS